jgi:hypothetical protein
MPRENIHWQVLEGTFTALKSTDLVPNSEIERAAAYLGAMTPDAPLFFNGGGSSFQEISEKLHGNTGEDTFEFLRSLAPRIFEAHTEEERRILLFFWIGYLSHCVTDSILHPLVFYITGNYYDILPAKRKEARKAHRLYETYLDLWSAQQYPALPWDRFHPIYNALGENLSVICTHLDQIAPGETRGCWKKAFSHMRFFQKLFISPSVGIVVRLLATLLPQLFSGHDALFSFGRSELPPSFHQTIEYQNPITGARCQATLQTLMERAISQTVELINRSAPALNSNQVPLNNVVGPSLCSGISNTEVQQLRYFA